MSGGAPARWPTFDGVLGACLMAASLVMSLAGADRALAGLVALAGFWAVGFDLGRSLSGRDGVSER